MKEGTKEVRKYESNSIWRRVGLEAKSAEDRTASAKLGGHNGHCFGPLGRIMG